VRADPLAVTSQPMKVCTRCGAEHTTESRPCVPVLPEALCDAHMGTGPRAGWGPPPILAGSPARQNAQATPMTPGVTLLGKERGSLVNYQREPIGGRPSRGQPGGAYIGAGAIVAIAIIVVLIILIF
jgi:hypothetical protein